MDSFALFELRDCSIHSIRKGSVGFDFLAKAIERHIDGAIFEPPRQLSQGFQGQAGEFARQEKHQVPSPISMTRAELAPQSKRGARSELFNN